MWADKEAEMKGPKAHNYLHLTLAGPGRYELSNQAQKKKKLGKLWLRKEEAQVLEESIN